MRHTIPHAREFPGLLRFLVGRFFYTDPANTVIVFIAAALHAESFNILMIDQAPVTLIFGGQDDTVPVTQFHQFADSARSAYNRRLVVKLLTVEDKADERSPGSYYRAQETQCHARPYNGVGSS